MLTNTRSSEDLFFPRLEELMAQHHPGLRFEIPPAYSRLEGPTPDFVVTNPRTGSALGAKVRVGYQAKAIPLVLISYVHALRKRFRSMHPSPSDVVVITTGEIPKLLQGWLAGDGIEYFEVSSPEEAVERLNPRLERL